MTVPITSVEHLADATRTTATCTCGDTIRSATVAGHAVLTAAHLAATSGGRHSVLLGTR
jgi:hypothetical protein